MPGKPRIQVAAALIEQDGRFLIARRKEGVHLEGLWEFPGGKCEAGESFESCLQRELLEELGVEITQPQLFMTHHHEYLENSVELKFFFCTILRGRPTPLGCAELCWVPVYELHRYEFPPADLPVLRCLIEMASSAPDSGSRNSQ